ncbi:MAG TPA: hypothetical protein PK307_00785 [Spirochaetota bacterium]|nr:hypothetical protein [Spirochaetota bacterium]HOD13909.1 hypothetical protein [Spirochaetota bacterium]HPG49705.1 hypothetical protein [Spirochaetota bacterium]HPN12411.1 hypothetical protein [Spirochaetota bacterium]HQL80707.1 hypothetical protein [Spirochaetota bacterium]
MNLSMKIALLFSSVYFMTGLVTGVWKYRCIRKSKERTAPFYVNVAHRSSFTYSFAALLVSILLGQSPYPGWLNMTITVTLMTFFTITMASYIANGIKGLNETQFASPPATGGEAGRDLFMTALILAEIIAFGLLAAGFAFRSFR